MKYSILFSLLAFFLTINNTQAVQCFDHRHYDPQTQTCVDDKEDFVRDYKFGKARNQTREWMRTCADQDGKSDIMPILSPLCYGLLYTWPALFVGSITYPFAKGFGALADIIEGKEVVRDTNGYIIGYRNKKSEPKIEIEAISDSETIKRTPSESRQSISDTIDYPPERSFYDYDEVPSNQKLE